METYNVSPSSRITLRNGKTPTTNNFITRHSNSSYYTRDGSRFIHVSGEMTDRHREALSKINSFNPHNPINVSQCIGQCIYDPGTNNNISVSTQCSNGCYDDKYYMPTRPCKVSISAQCSNGCYDDYYTNTPDGTLNDKINTSTQSEYDTNKSSRYCGRSNQGKEKMDYGFAPDSVIKEAEDLIKKGSKISKVTLDYAKKTQFSTDINDVTKHRSLMLQINNALGKSSDPCVSAMNNHLVHYWDDLSATQTGFIKLKERIINEQNIITNYWQRKDATKEGLNQLKKKIGFQHKKELNKINK